MTTNDLPSWAEDIRELVEEAYREEAQNRQDLIHVPQRTRKPIALWAADILGEPIERIEESLRQGRADALLRIVLLIKYRAGEADIPFYLIAPYVASAPPANVETKADLERSLKGINEMAALDSLAEGFFSRSAVIPSQAWAANGGALQEAFREYRGDRAHSTAWRDLIRTPLFLAIRDMPGTTKLREIPRYVRGKLRQEIEKELLHGLTPFTHLARGKTETPLPEEDSPDMMALSASFAVDLGKLCDMEIDVLTTLNQLSERHAAAVLAPLLGRKDTEVAEQFEVKEATVRKWRNRGKSQIRNLQK